MPGQPFHENANTFSGVIPRNPRGGATSNDNRFLFIVNQGSVDPNSPVPPTISVFKIIPTSGTTGVAGEPVEVLGSATTTSPFACTGGCTAPSFVAVAKANNAIYVLDSSTNKIFQFAVNQNTGQLRALTPAFVLAESTPTWITIN
jgi:hypothetical protein